MFAYLMVFYLILVYLLCVYLMVVYLVVVYLVVVYPLCVYLTVVYLTVFVVPPALCEVGEADDGCLEGEGHGVLHHHTYFLYQLSRDCLIKTYAFVALHHS